MKLALLASRLPPANDGVGDHADRLATALGAAGHDVVVVSAGEAAPPRGYRLEIAGGTWGPVTTARAIALLREHAVEALAVEYTPFLYGARSQTALAVLGAARALRMRTTVIVHEAFHRRGSSAVRSAWKAGAFAARDAATLACADTIAVQSAGRAAEIARRMPRARIAVVPIGANIEPPAHFVRRVRNQAPIVAFGVVMPRRRLERCLEAVARLVERGDDVRLDIVGRIHDAGYAAEIARRAGSRGLGERVRFRGELAPAELSAELAGAPAALHTAEDGSIASSGSLLALLAHGVPIVALRTRFDDPVFRGVLHFAGDDSELATALHAIVKEPACASGLSRSAVACYRANFGWPAIAARLCETLQTEAAYARPVPA